MFFRHLWLVLTKKREDLINIHELITIAILTSKNGIS